MKWGNSPETIPNPFGLAVCVSAAVQTSRRFPVPEEGAQDASTDSSQPVFEHRASMGVEMSPNSPESVVVCLPPGGGSRPPLTGFENE